MENTQKNESRPLSPHLSIYKPQITSVLSILHRATGIFLFFSLVLLFWLFSFILMHHLGLVLIDFNFLAITDNLLFKLFLFATSFSLYYHLANGIRHLFWDIGKGFSLPAVYRSGYAVIIFTLILTCITAYCWFFYKY